LIASRSAASAHDDGGCAKAPVRRRHGNIVAKALRKLPAEHDTTVDAFAADLRRKPSPLAQASR